MMKKLLVIALISGAVVMAACGDGIKRKPGRAYMPDMMYSRAYETYSLSEDHRKELEKQGIYLTATPVPGTVKRGVDYTFRLAKDNSIVDSSNYVAARGIKNPVTLDSVSAKEAERLYLVNCGICHGPKLDGDGPLYKGGDGPFSAKPANLITSTIADGQMFYVVTYGKNLMGSYASQLDATQRWQVIAYIRSKQAGGGTASATPGSAATPAVTGASANADSTAKQK